MSTTDELHRVADALERRAAVATPGPWISYSGRVDAPGNAANIAGARFGHNDSEWIALANPTWVRPLVAWLRDAAEEYNPRDDAQPNLVVHALDLARLINTTHESSQ